MSGDQWAYWQHKLRAWVCLLVALRQPALREFTAMLALRPGDAYALSSRAHVLAESGQRDAAITDAQELTARHPRRSGADWFNLAFLLDDAGRWTEAEQAFRQAIELDPKLDRAWYGLGLSLVRQQRFDDAAKALKRNTELQPMSPYGWYQLARVQMDRQQPEEARRIIRHLLNFEPKIAAQLQRETGLVP